MEATLNGKEIIKVREEVQEKLDTIVYGQINAKNFEKADHIISRMDYFGFDVNELKINLDVAVSSEIKKVEREKDEGRDPEDYHEVN